MASEQYVERVNAFGEIVRIQVRAKRIIQVASVLSFLGSVAGAASLLFWFELAVRPTSQWLGAVELFLLCAVVLASARWLLVPGLKYQIKQVEAAFVIEQEHPELRDRVAPYVALLNDEPNEFSSPVLCERAVTQLPTCETHRRAFEGIRTGRFVLLAAASICLIAMLLIGISRNAELAAVATKRVLMPWENTTWPARHQIVFRDFPNLVQSGTVVEIQVEDTRGKLPRSTELKLRRDGQLQSLKLVHEAGVAKWTSNKLNESIELMASGGDGSTGWNRIRVIPVPKINKLEWQLQPPPELGLPSYQSKRDLIGIKGSRLTGWFEFNQSLASASIVFEANGNEREIPLQIEEGSKRGLLTLDQNCLLEESGRYRIQTVDQNGLVDNGQNDFQVRAIENSRPTAMLKMDAHQGMVAYDGKLKLQVEAFDVTRIQRLELTVTTEAGEQIDVPLTPISASVAPLEQQRGPAGERFEGFAEIEVPSLNVKAGQELLFKLEVEDPIGQLAVVEPLTIEVVDESRMLSSLGSLEVRLAQLLSNACKQQSLSIRRFTQLGHALAAPNEGAIEPQFEYSLRLLVDAEQLQQRVFELAGNRPGQALDVVAQIKQVLSQNALVNSSLYRRVELIETELLGLESKVFPKLDDAISQAEFQLRSGLANARFDFDRSALAEVESQQLDVQEVLEEIRALVDRQQDLSKIREQLSQVRRTQIQIRKQTSAGRIRIVSGELEPTEQDLLGEQLSRRQYDLHRSFDNATSQLQALGDTDSGDSETTPGRQDSDPVTNSRPRASDAIRIDAKIARQIEAALSWIEQESIHAEMLDAGKRIELGQWGLSVQRQSNVEAQLGRLIEILDSEQMRNSEQRAEQLSQLRNEIQTLRDKELQLSLSVQIERNEADANLDAWQVRQEEIASETDSLASSIDTGSDFALRDKLFEAADEMSNVTASIKQQEWEQVSSGFTVALEELDEALAILAGSQAAFDDQELKSQLQDRAKLIRNWRDRQLQIVTGLQNQTELANDQPLLASHRLRPEQSRLINEMRSAIRNELSESEGIKLVVKQAILEAARAEQAWIESASKGEVILGLQRTIDLFEQLLGILEPDSQSQTPANSDSSNEQTDRRQEIDLRLVRILQQNIYLQTKQLQEWEGYGNNLTSAERESRLLELARLESELVGLVQRLLIEMQTEIEQSPLPDDAPPQITLPLPDK